MAYLGHKPAVGENNSFRILDDISSFVLTFDGSSASVVGLSDETITITENNHRFITGQRVTYSNGGGGNITGLTNGQAYFVINHSKTQIKLASSASNALAGTAVNLTGLGTGSSHTLTLAFDGVNTKFDPTFGDGMHDTLIKRAAQLVISINGVIQQPHDTATPSTGFGVDSLGHIIFSTAPASTDIFWGHILATNTVTFDSSDNDVDTFTGNGSTTSFTLSKIPPDNRNILVTIDGVVQYPSDAANTRSYNVSENVMTFVAAPGNGTVIQVRHIGYAGIGAGGGGGVTGFYGRTGNVSLISTDNITVNDAAITGDATITGDTTVTGNLTVDGDMTTLNTTLREVELLRVDATSTLAAGIITQRNSGDILNLFDNNTEVLTVTDGGLVGIGTDIPHHLLDVKGNAIFGPIQNAGNPGQNTGIATVRGHFVNAVGDFARLYFSNSVSAGGVVPPNAYISGKRDGIQGSNWSAGLAFYTDYRNPSSNTPIERMVIGSTGFVGIASARPQQRLDVMGTIQKTRTNGEPQVKLQEDSSANGQIVIHNNSNVATTVLSSANNGVSYFTGSSIKVGIGTTVPQEILHIHENGTGPCDVRISNSEGYGFLRSDSNLLAYNAELHLFANRDRSEEYMRITNDGEIGIGTISPQAKLELDGRFRILDNNDGTPSSGKGLEISYYTSDDMADILSYDRSAGAYKKLQLRGSSVEIKKNNSVLINAGVGGNGVTVGFSTTVNLVTNAERIAVRGYSSFKSTNAAYAAIYLASEGATDDTANQLLMFNAGGANRGGIGYVPNTGELRFNHQYFTTFCTGAQLMGGTERLRIHADGNIETKGLQTFEFNGGWSAEGRNVVIWPFDDAGNWFSFVGTNLRFTDGGNFVKPSDNSNSNWGNIAGLVFEGVNQNNTNGDHPAIRFVVDQPGENGPNYSLGSGSSGRAAAIDNNTTAFISGNGNFIVNNKIGIGEDNPDANALLIRAASTVGTKYGHIMLTGDGATTDEGPQIMFSESGSASNYAGGSIGFQRKGDNGQGDLIFGTRGTSGSANTVTSERLRIQNGGNVQIGNAVNAGNALRYLDVANFHSSGADTGSILRLLTTKSDGSSSTGLDIVKYRAGGAYIINNENVGTDTGFIAFNTASDGIGHATHLRIAGNGEVVVSPRNGGASNNKTSIHFNNEVHTPFISFKSNNVTEAAYIRVPESSGGANLEFRTKNTSGTLLSRLTLKNNGEIVTHQLAGSEKGFPLVMGTGTVADNTNMSGSFNYHDVMGCYNTTANNFPIGGWVALGNDYGPAPYPARRFKIFAPNGFTNGTIVYQVWHDGDSNYYYGGLYEIRINCWTDGDIESVTIRLVNGYREDLRVFAYNDSNGIMIQTSSIWGRVFIRRAGWDDGGRNPGSSHCAVANNGALAIYNSQGTDDGTPPSGGVELYCFDGQSGSAGATHTGGYNIEGSAYFDG